MAIVTRRSFAVGLCLVVMGVFARTPPCAVCGGALAGRIWTYEDQACCSPACADRLYPTCSACGRVIREPYIQAHKQNYCNETCYETTLDKCAACGAPIHAGFEIANHTYCTSCVKERPTCFSCGLPARYPVRIADGREICTHCMRWAVKTQAEAQKHYVIARRNLEAWTGLKISSVPRLELVDRNEMQELSKALRKSDSPVSIRGLYSRQVTITTQRFLWGRKTEARDERETIYLVDHLHDEVFRTAAVHELMHDLIYEHFNRLEAAPLWVHEGICQRAAAEYAARRGYADVLYGIEHCDDPDYGDGYRYMSQFSGYAGWLALRQWMEHVDVASLPERVPTKRGE